MLFRSPEVTPTPEPTVTSPEAPTPEGGDITPTPEDTEPTKAPKDKSGKSSGGSLEGPLEFQWWMLAIPGGLILLVLIIMIVMLNKRK